VKESRRNEIMRREESREGVEKTGDMGKKKRKNRQRVMEERKC